MNVEGDSVSVLTGDGAGGFAPMSGSPLVAPRLPGSIATGDFNQDGLIDLAVTSTYSNPSGWLTVFLRASEDSSPLPSLWPWGFPGGSLRGISHDGRIDLGWPFRIAERRGGIT